MELKLGAGFNDNIGLYPLSASLDISYFSNISQNVDLSGKIKNVSFLVSTLVGRQGLTGNYNVNDYNYSNTDVYVDYSYSLFDDKVNIRPAISYQSAYVNDKEYTVDVGESGTFDGEGRINNYAGSLKIDAKLVEKLRLILAGRFDQFNYPKEGVFSNQAVLNYSPGEDHLFHLIAGRSYSGSFLLPTLINSRSELAPNIDVNLQGNNNLSLLSNTMYEFGYRTKIVNNFIADFSAFTQTFSDFNNLILEGPEFDPTIGKTTFNFSFKNLPLEVKQQGVTVSVQGNLLDSKIQLRSHVTLQETKVENYSPYYNVKGAWDNPMFGTYIRRSCR